MKKNSKNAVTIQDVADAVGVTKATVSKVMSGKGRISPATSEAVRQVARRLNFQPNPHASWSWIATIDKFQHWVYTHPGHDRAERRQAWLDIFHEFKSTCVDHSGLEEYAAHLWHKQLHLYEVPFYYIEYGMAQLGAIAIWKQYREDPAGTVKRYGQALQRGYTRTISEIYETAGIRFDFSAENVAELGAFVKGEIDRVVGG